MSDTLAADLFAPTSIGAIDVTNRIVMAPLTRSRAGMDGVHGPLAVDYYRQRASAGLIVTEATNISQQGRGYAYTPGIYTDAHAEAWREVTDAVHESGGKIVLQLWHVGRVSHFSLQEGGAPPVAPSAIRAGGRVYTLAGDDVPSMPRALEADEIPGLVEDYRNAAHLAKKAGFDGVEVHAANGYLLDQFLRDSTNRRTDLYGGSVGNRARFPIEVVKAVAEIWGADRVGVRISPLSTAIGETPLDSDPQATYGYFVQQLGGLGLAYLHAVEGQLREANAASALDFKALHAAFGGAYIANNGYDRQLAMDAIASGHADMISFGRAFIGNPDLVERLRRNAPLFEAPLTAYYGGGAEGYTDFPTLAD
ncbi:alkene reductase [Novosphingobium sp. NBM11]|uniref:alkene reductase n=1 Tax=Novosphingobium sp. NBM11 TaxID=2596914 RepID=UPI00086D806D|nr:alkene reductase [Novosphingobium sp. NBM11]MBF5093057.1 alkene reductase [Novosphingobium sp. NBM11]ODU68283.1 MAG: alkene reductase [Novosphingobium sp. SCN 66-18]